jgi:hypothetical protein
LPAFTAATSYTGQAAMNAKTVACAEQSLFNFCAARHHHYQNYDA